MLGVYNQVSSHLFPSFKRTVSLNKASVTSEERKEKEKLRNTPPMDTRPKGTKEERGNGGGREYEGGRKYTQANELLLDLQYIGRRVTLLLLNR